MQPAGGNTNVANPRVLSDVRLQGMIGLWALSLVGWMGYLTWYSNAPGADATAPSVWPADSTIERSAHRPTLLMFIHPRCPCTSASLEELARVVTRCRNSAEYVCVFVRPLGVPDKWERDSLWDEASRIPFVRRVVDNDGIEARRFGAKTSGAVQLFMDNGRLAFSGGVTGARNHAGDNVGADAVIDWIISGGSDCSSTFVFGCSLF